MLNESRRKIVANKTSRKTLRNNAGIIYVDRGGHGTLQYGLLTRVLLKGSRAYAVVSHLTPAGIKLCTDSITHANLDHRLTALQPPR